MRRFVTIAFSLAFLLGSTQATRLFAFAQDEKKSEAKQDEKKDDAKKDDAKQDEKKDDAKKDDAKQDDKKEDAKKDDAKKAEEKPAEAKKDDTKSADESKPAEPPIPPEVQAKIDAARKAIAEAIVAAQDAGLVSTTIDPPPILDIIITGRANDAVLLKGKSEASPEVGVSPEVFGAWFTGFGKMDGITPEKNVRIVPPSKGLTDWYRQRATVMGKYLTEARKAKGEPPKTEAAPKAEEKKADEPKADEKKAEEKKADEPKADEKKAEEKKEEPKEEKKDEPKKDN